MKLRSRLALTAAGTLLPVVVALFWVDAAAQHRVAKERLVQFVHSRMANGRHVCETAPERWGGVHGGNRPPGPRPPMGPPRHDDRGPPPPPPEGFSSNEPRRGPPPPPPFDEPPPRAEPAVLFAYGEDFISKNPGAPALPASLTNAMATEDIAEPSFFWPTSRIETLLRMPWKSGPCAYIYARGTTDPSWGAILPESFWWLLPVFVVLAAVLVAVGPVIARIRRLTDAVRRSAANGYTLDVAKSPHHEADEIGELAAAFDAASHEVRAALAEKELREKALREFVANTTHDVMVPLSVLQGHLTTLRERHTGEPSVVVSAMHEAHYMASLIHNLAVAARLESAQISLQQTPVDLGALIARVLARHRPIAKQLDIALESAIPDEPVIVSADVTLLEQAVSNVTYNAIRYNRPGGHVALLLEEADANGFTLRIMDDGPGIAAEQLSRLVERGYRGDAARSRAPDGQGLGLHIAFRAAELHGYVMTLRASEAGGLEVLLAGIKR